MTIKFVWDKKYSVGDAAIDSQHKKILEMANAIIEGMDAEAAKKHVMALYEYTRVHFRDEEAMMKRIGYPKVDEHRELHNQLITTLNDNVATQLSTPDSLKKFKAFILHWVFDHIMTQDADYFEFSKKKV